MDEEFRTISYWEFPAPRKSFGDSGGRMGIAESYEDIPDVVRDYAVQRKTRVPLMEWARTDFDLLSWLKLVQKLREYRPTPSQPSQERT